MEELQLDCSIDSSMFCVTWMMWRECALDDSVVNATSNTNGRRHSISSGIPPGTLSIFNSHILRSTNGTNHSSIDHIHEEITCWLRAVQLLCNSVQKCVISCNYNYRKRNIAIQNRSITRNKKVAWSIMLCMVWQETCSGHKALTVANLLIINVNADAVSAVWTL